MCDAKREVLDHLSFASPFALKLQLGREGESPYAASPSRSPSRLDGGNASEASKRCCDAK